MSSQKRSKSSKKESVESSKTDLVCVTGANGFLGAWIVKNLLDRGYRVRGTVRNTRDAAKTKHLLALDGADERLELVNASLDDDDAFMDVFKGCKYVIHNASPFFLTPKDAQKDLVDPAVKGSLAAMNAALANKVKKIVVTSSINAITDEPVKLYNENDWNTTSSLKRMPYHYSKVLAERACWDFIDQHKDDKHCPKLATILPAGISGPSLGENGLSNPTNDVFRQILDGELPGILKIALSFVDVRDVSLSHVLAMENRKANGRYICAAESIYFQEIAQILRQAHPQAKVTKKDWTGPIMSKMVKFFMGFSSDGQNQFVHYYLGNFPQFDTSKTTGELGLPAFRDVRPGWHEVCKQLIDAGMIKSLSADK